MAALHTHLAKAIERRRANIAAHRKATLAAAELARNRAIAGERAAAAASIPASPGTPQSPKGNTP